MWRGSFERNHGNRGTCLAVRVQIKGSKRIAQGNKENPTHIFHWAKWGSAVWTHERSLTVRRKVGGGAAQRCLLSWGGGEARIQTDDCNSFYEQHLFQEGLTQRSVFLALHELCSVMSGSPLCPSIHIWMVVICPEQDKSGPRKKCQYDRVRHDI